MESRSGSNGHPPEKTSLEPELTGLLERIKVMSESLDERQAELQKKEESFKDYAQQEIQRMKEEEERQRHQLAWEKEALSREKENFKHLQERSIEIIEHQEPVTIEVGGEKFRTELRTLSQCKGSIFPQLVTALPSNKKEKPINIFIDRDGRHFRFILNYLRMGERVMYTSAMKNADEYLLNEILFEVEYYHIVDLERLIKRKQICFAKNSLLTFETLLKCKFLAHVDKSDKFITMKTFSIRDKNLTGICFNKVVFKHQVMFENCVMTSAIFSECDFSAGVNFANVDLYKSVFSNCTAVKQHNFKDCNMMGTTFNPQI